VDRFTWKDVQLNFTDHYNVTDPITLGGSAGVEGSNLRFDPAATSTTRSAGGPGQFSAWLAAPGIAEWLTLAGTLQADNRGATVAADLSGNGITGAALAHYLKPLGLELTLKDGRVQAKTSATVALSDAGNITADVNVDGATYTDGDQELAGIDALRIAGATLKPDGIAVDLVQLTKPRGRITRSADGELEA